MDDKGFLLSEHIAIMQYICDKYAPDSKAYPKDPTLRALINHRLCYNMAHFYSAVAPYTLAPIFFEVIDGTVHDGRKFHNFIFSIREMLEA